MIPSMETTLLGHEVRRARTALGLTFAQVSARTGIATSTLHSIEVGEIKYPTERVLRPLADALEPETSYRDLALKVYGLEPALA